MSNRTYRVTEVVGTSQTGVDDAINNAVKRASRTLRHLDWFEVTQIRGQVLDEADLEVFDRVVEAPGHGSGSPRTSRDDEVFGWRA